MTPIPGKIPVNPAQVENSLKLVEAKITLHEQRLRTYREHGRAWRALVDQATDDICAGRSTASSLMCVMEARSQEWRAAHKSMEEAEAQLMEVAIAELKSQASIYKAMLSEADESEHRILRPDRRM